MEFHENPTHAQTVDTRPFFFLPRAKLAAQLPAREKIWTGDEASSVLCIIDLFFPHKVFTSRVVLITSFNWPCFINTCTCARDIERVGLLICTCAKNSESSSWYTLLLQRVWKIMSHYKVSEKQPRYQVFFWQILRRQESSQSDIFHSQLRPSLERSQKSPISSCNGELQNTRGEI